MERDKQQQASLPSHNVRGGEGGGPSESSSYLTPPTHLFKHATQRNAPRRARPPLRN